MANALEDLIGEGILEGERQALRRVVKARFQSVPEALERRIAGANQQEIDRLLERASVAINIDDIA